MASGTVSKQALKPPQILRGLFNARPGMAGSLSPDLRHRCFYRSCRPYLGQAVLDGPIDRINGDVSSTDRWLWNRSVSRKDLSPFSELSCDTSTTRAPVR